MPFISDTGFLAPPGAIRGESNGPFIARATISLYILAVLVVLLRYYARGVYVKAYGVEDIYMGIATLIAGGMTGVIMLQVKLGVGRHIWDQSSAELVAQLKVAWVEQFLYYSALLAVKLSILALYKRISGHKIYQIAIWTSMAFATSLSFVGIVLTIWACNPISGSWELSHGMNGTHNCISIRNFNLAMGALNILSDVTIILLPIPSLVGLHVNSKRKVAIVLIFSVGCIAPAGSLIRLSAFSIWWKGFDFCRKWGYMMLSGHVEVNVAIITASLPSLSPLLRRFLQSTRSGSSEMRGPGYAMGSMHGTRGYTAHISKNAKKHRIPSDLNESEEDIVERNVEGEVTKTVQVSVHYS